MRDISYLYGQFQVENSLYCVSTLQKLLLKPSLSMLK